MKRLILSLFLLLTLFSISEAKSNKLVIIDNGVFNVFICTTSYNIYTKFIEIDTDNIIPLSKCNKNKNLNYFLNYVSRNNNAIVDELKNAVSYIRISDGKYIIYYIE